jgi:hypothetical protein
MTADAEAGSAEGQPTAVSAIDVASMPWAFTQHHPLDTAEFIKEAESRGVNLRPETLRALYRAKLLEPLLYVTNHRVGPEPGAVANEPQRGGTRLQQLRSARDRGRLSDPADSPFRRRLRFDQRKVGDPPGWWNGLLYSWYQLLICPELDPPLSQLKGWRTSRDSVIGRVPRPGPFLSSRAARIRRIALVLAALEARYLPTLDSEWLRLVNAERTEWQRYRDGFDPEAVSLRLSYSAEQARQDGEWLLLRANDLDPVGDSWGHLMRRAPESAWKELKDAALSALDYRIAAEILLRFYEDLADRGAAEPLPRIADMGMGWHPLRDRLSSREQALDQDLMDLGISPHPRVILAVEGETEQAHVPLVWRELDYPDAPELMRLFMLGGVNKNLEKVASLAAAPLLGPRIQGARPGWALIKPPTCFYVAVDPEGRYFAPQNVDRTRAAMLEEISATLKGQGVTAANSAELDELIKIHTWSGPCYEYGHFTDEELADGIIAIHETINGWTRDQLVEALGYWRSQTKDIKRTWESGRWDDERHTVTGPWEYEVSKTKLAEALWPTLKAKIDRCRVDAEAPVPEVVEVVQDAYRLAQRWRYPSFALSEDPDSAAASE